MIESTFESSGDDVEMTDEKTNEAKRSNQEWIKELLKERESTPTEVGSLYGDHVSWEKLGFEKD